MPTASKTPDSKVKAAGAKQKETAKTTTITIPNSKVALELPEGEEEDKILNFPAFKQWFSRIQHNLSLQSTDSKHEFHTDPYTLSHIKIEHVDHWGPRIGFIKLTATVKNKGLLTTDNKEEQLAGSMLLRGPSVSMLVILQPEDLKADSEKEKYVVLTTQARIAAGGLRFLELPAGMVDDKSFKGAAAAEIKEELGIEIPPEALNNMSEKAILAGGEEDMPRAMFPSAGGCDEFIQLFLYEKRIPREDLDKWNGKFTGLRDQGEKITLKLVKLEDLWKEGARDAKALAALSLYENLRREGKLYE